MFVKKRIILILISIIAITNSGLIFAQISPWEKGGFDNYINGDGSSLKQAVIIKVADLRPCATRECLRNSWKEIIKQEHAYLIGQFGKMGINWDLEGEDNWVVDIEENEKYYDKVAIRLIGGDQKILYFDITDPVIRLEVG